EIEPQVKTHHEMADDENGQIRGQVIRRINPVVLATDFAMRTGFQETLVEPAFSAIGATAHRAAKHPGPDRFLTHRTSSCRAHVYQDVPYNANDIAIQYLKYFRARVRLQDAEF